MLRIIGCLWAYYFRWGDYWNTLLDLNKIWGINYVPVLIFPHCLYLLLLLHFLEQRNSSTSKLISGSCLMPQRWIWIGPLGKPLLSALLTFPFLLCWKFIRVKIGRPVPMLLNCWKTWRRNWQCLLSAMILSEFIVAFFNW